MAIIITPYDNWIHLIETKHHSTSGVTRHYWKYSNWGNEGGAGSWDFGIRMLFRLNLYQYVKFSLYYTSLYFFHIRSILLVFFIFLFFLFFFYFFIFLSLMNLDTHEWLIINNLNQNIMILFILFSFISTIKKNINCSQQREHYLKSV